MNSRRVHTLFLKHYPVIALVDCEWVHIMREGMPCRDMIDERLAFLNVPQVLIHVHRKLGDFLPPELATDFICDNVGHANIRVTDRDFSRFVIVAHNGVAATWP
jgi:hypothetical protein